MAEAKKIPLHTRIGGRITIFLVLLICFMLVKNCVRAVYYGIVTDEKEISRYYESGFKAGAEPPLQKTATHELKITNPLLLKAFRTGFREGKDSTNIDISRGKENEKK